MPIALAWPISLSRRDGPLPLSLVSTSSSKERMLTQERPTTVAGLAQAQVVKDENLFFLAQPDGMVPVGGNHGLGLYFHDCRFLNGYELRLNDHAPRSLSATAWPGHSAIVQLTNPMLPNGDEGHLKVETLGIEWERFVESQAPALHDHFRVQNFGRKPAHLVMDLTFQADFEDVYVIRGLIEEKPGEKQPPQWEHGALSFGYAGKDGLFRSVTIHFSERPTSQKGTSAGFSWSLRPGEAKELRVAVVLRESKKQGGGPSPSYHMPDVPELRRTLDAENRKWREHIPNVSSDSALLNRSLDRSFRDLRVLRSRLGKDGYFSAGVPWFATLFGRDSLITSLQMLAFDSRIAEETLRLLARYQGQQEDDWRDEAPGKILHEYRIGELANLGRIPHTPYYGTIDATPLFLILIGLYLQWTGDMKVFEDLRGNVERALDWMARYGDRDQDGYLEYQATPSGSDKPDMARLINKGWKDSGNAIVNEDGSLAESPIALVEVQAYAYWAKRLMGDAFEQAGEAERARRLRHEADTLKTHFNEDFWSESKGLYLLARQKSGKPVAVVSSNAGHALWAGIADDKKAAATATRLMESDMFAGWGVRTLASTERAFNPIGYHLGTVWPHDNALIAAGFRRYGHDEFALQIFEGLLLASSHFENEQLPELFCGFPQPTFPRPVQYPVACHPQAWAAGSVPYLLTSMLGLQADAFQRRLVVKRPVLPGFMSELEIRGIRVGDGHADLRFERRDGRLHVLPLKTKGRLEVVVQEAS